VALVNKIFWSVAAIEALFFVAAFILTVNQGGQDPDGGKGMALTFGIALPFLILCVVSLIFWKTSSPTVHIILLIAAIVPMVVLAGQWIRGPLMDRDIARGGYIYEDSKLKKFAGAIASLDEKRVREIAPQVDINTVGSLGLTPLKFAIENVDRAKAEQVAASIQMIHLLLSLGAKPDSALPKACGASHEETVGILLDAGADPNYKDEEGTPAFFFCNLNALNLLATKGCDFNALNASGESVLINAATFSRWDKILFFLDHGVQDRPTPNGKTAASMVTQAIADDKQNSRETSPSLKQVDAKLGAKLNH
jgi:hypothetical protein